MEEAVAESESTLAYQHASGEIHIARSPEEAILLCTHLGQMVMEEGGQEKARRMIKLYVIGAEIIAREDEEAEEVDELEQQEDDPQPGEKTDKPKQGELLVSKKEPRREELHNNEQSNDQPIPKQETVQFGNSPTEIEVTDNKLGTKSETSRTATVSKSQPEKGDTAAPVQEIVAAARLTLGNTKDIYEAIAPAAGPKNFDQGSASATEVPTAPTKKEITRQTISIEKPAERLVTTLKALSETDQVDSPPSAEPVTESRENSASAGTISVEADLDETMLAGSEITGPDAFDEFQQMSDEPLMEVFYEREVDGEEFVLLIPELPVPVEQVEQAVQELTERIEKIEAEESELVHQILDEIVLKVEEAHSVVEPGAESQEDSIEKIEETQEELKELFVQLFEMAGIEYTEELIESFVKLTLKQEIPELILKAEPEEETNLVHDSGTHEIIKQILVAITRTKKAALHAYRIGQSAVRLYSQQLALA